MCTKAKVLLKGQHRLSKPILWIRMEQVRMELLKKPVVKNFGSSIKELEDSLDPLLNRN